MKVKLRDIKPNPFRRLDRYPIDKEKVERLVTSIKHTGFWDNIVGRKVGDSIEISYGHHRLEALKYIFKPNDEIEVIIKNLDDDKMLQIMADENDDLYSMSPSVINETVKVVRDHLRNTKRLGDTAVPSTREMEIISDFLRWGKSRVKNALADIHSMEDGSLIREAETLPSQRHSTELRQTIKKYKLSPSVQKMVIDKVKTDGLGYRGMKKEMEKYIDIRKDDTFDSLLKETAQAIRNADGKIKQIINRRGRISSERGYIIFHDLKQLGENAKKLLEILNEEEKGEEKIRKNSNLLDRK